MGAVKPRPPASPLELLAGRRGVEPEWRDNWGGVHPTSASSAAGLLRAMGVAAGTSTDAEASLRADEEASWSEFLPPVVVARAAAPPERITVHVPRQGRSAPPSIAVALEIAEENGWRRQSSFGRGEIRHMGTKTLGERTWDRYGVPLPGPLPLGYHTLHVAFSTGKEVRSGSCRLIAHPEKAWMPGQLEEGGKAAGLAVALYGLRSARNWGVGDFGDLRRLTVWAVSQLGVSFIGLNPLHAARNRFPYSHSPYLPLSSLFPNYLYLDMESVPEYAESGEARRIGAESEPFLAGLRASRHVNYDEASRLKLGALRAAFREFLRRHWHAAGASPRRRQLEEFIAREGQALERFAVFSALDEHFAASGAHVWSWRHWPLEYQRPDTPAVRQFLADHPEDVLFWQYVQLALDEQLGNLALHARHAGLSLGYYHDLALAVDEHGADYWAQQDLFARGARVGAPPDDFNAEGQDWGFPPPHPERDRAGGWQAFVGQLRRACRHAGLLRIDHVMRLARLFWIPDGKKASEGAYVRYRKEELFGIVALESVRNQTVIVGEDLGVVPEGFREEMAERAFCSCRLLWFERHADGRYREPDAYPTDAMVSISTHDLPTFAGFWSGHDLETRRRIGLFRSEEDHGRALAERRYERRRLLELLVRRGLLPPGRELDPGEPALPDGELHNAVVGLLCQTPSRLFLLAQEDLFKVLDQQNVPGTVTQRPNWVWKMPFTLEELFASPEVRNYAAMFHGWIDRSGRVFSRRAR